jgi:hypothetical protein
MGCGCGGGRTYVRPTTMTQSASQHAPQTRVVPFRQTYAPPPQEPRVIQASRRPTQTVVRRQI